MSNDITTTNDHGIILDINKIEELTSKYIIRDEIGSGGMAKIYKATRKSDGITVAIKIISDSKKTNVVINFKRFSEEIKLAKKLINISNNVVKFYEGNVNIEKRFAFLVMEYVEGSDLRKMIRRMNGFRDFNHLVKIAKQICLGTASIHKAGIIHRDLKSQNILITHNDQVKIIDFGISLGSETTRYTEENKIISSINYVAPEILNHREPTIQSDVYSFGILLIEMISSTLPFYNTDSKQVITDHKSGKINNVIEDLKITYNVPPRIIRIIKKCTYKDLELRYKNFDQIYKDFNLINTPQKTSTIKLIDPTIRINSPRPKPKQSKNVKLFNNKQNKFKFLESKKTVLILIGIASAILIIIVILVIWVVV